MGNICTTSQKKKDSDDVSDKSEDSPSYQLATKKDIKNTKDGNKEAPLADPEQISDLSTGHNILITGNSPTNGNLIKGTSAHIKFQSTISDSVSSTPQTLNPPCELPTVPRLPINLSTLQGKPITSRRTEKDRKIVIYILSADNGHQSEKTVLKSLFSSFQERCANRGFEVIISDTHHDNIGIPANDTDILDVRKWSTSPLEAQGGHDESANCLAEISRHSNFAYIIPVLFLGPTLGTPLLPLTIESQDFTSALNTAESSKRSLLEKWYNLDSTAQPACYRLNAKNTLTDPYETNLELNALLSAIVEVFSRELRDSYLTTVVEQEINNTVLISQELSKRCIWIQTGCQPPKLPENPTQLEIEVNRRLIGIHADLKNQLSEKNLIRIPPTIQVQEEQLAAIMESLINNVIEGVTEEHSHKYSIPHCTYGVDKRLLSEIETVSQYSKGLGQNCANFAIMDKIKSYLTGNSTAPLIIYGPPGSGKSVLAAKIMHNVHALIPETNLLLRYVNLTEQSKHLVSLVGSIAEQISFITYNQPCRVKHTLEAYTNFIKKSFELKKQHLVIVIDSLDQINGLNSIDWIPKQLSTNIKFVLTITANGPNDFNNPLLQLITNNTEHIIPNENYIELLKFSDEQWRDVLSYGGGDFYAANGALQLPDKWRLANEKTPLQAKILWWLAWLDTVDLNDTTIDKLIVRVFETIESKIGLSYTEFLISLLIASGDGIQETDIMQIFEAVNLVKENNITSSKVWFKFCWLMGPMLLNNNQITLMDKEIRVVATQRYYQKIKESHEILFNHYYKQSITFSDKKGKNKCYNIQKQLKLPYHAFMIDSQKIHQIQEQSQQYIHSKYLNDLQWIHDKLIATGCVQILSDLNLGEQYCLINGTNIHTTYKHLVLLKIFLEKHMRELNYDGDQFYTLFISFIQNTIKMEPNLEQNENLRKWKEFLTNITSTYLERLNEFDEIDRIDETTILDDDDGTNLKNHHHYYDAIMNLNSKGYFVASISTEREEICVWDVANCKRVRILNGVSQPFSLSPVGEYGAAVLCRREIKVIDLNEGKYRVTLKGVMNQKMPYFGLHDDSHLVCLSRNRMYVNLMNLESGDCITTFKAGEDRFLNSLLVSGDGRILVCGDETQKPFPLLVWHLTQRKLLYDLRIPHHDFITSLSAITHEGSYVCVVAKELSEPTPNFIVVYDLQSGTLFKKWKPSCNTVSLAISQTNACVVAGLEDARILIWDLVTGNCRCTLQGHNAPVTLLKLDPLGKILLSGDKDGRDMSVRVWELDSGKALAVYTPPAKISTCEILPNGKYIILALENHKNLITLILRNYHDDIDNQNQISFGNEENNGKIFDLN